MQDAGYTPSINQVCKHTTHQLSRHADTGVLLRASLPSLVHTLFYLVSEVDTGSMADQFPDDPHISILGCHYESCILRVLEIKLTVHYLIIASFPGPVRSSLAVRNSRRQPGLVHHVMYATGVTLCHTRYSKIAVLQR